MGFTEGFNSTFNTVDQAMGRRSALELEQQRMAKEDTRYADRLGREDAATAREGKWHDDAAAIAVDAVKYGKENDIKNFGYKDKEITLKEKEVANKLATDQATIGIHTATSKAQIAASNAQTEASGYELRAAKQAEAQKEAAIRIQQNFVKDDATQQMVLHWPETAEGRAKLIQDFSAAKLGDLPDMMTNSKAYQASSNALKSSLIDPASTARNPQPLLDGLNQLAGHEIKRNVGHTYDGPDKAYEGWKVKDAVATQVIPHPSGNGGNAPSYNLMITSTLVSPDGKKEASITGPATRNGSFANSDGVLSFDEQHIAKLVDKNDFVLNALNTDPASIKRVNDYVNSLSPKAKGDYSAIETKSVDKDGNPIVTATAVLNKQDGTVRQLENNTANEYLMKAQKVLGNPGNYTKEQVADANKFFAENSAVASGLGGQPEQSATAKPAESKLGGGGVNNAATPAPSREDAIKIQQEQAAANKENRALGLKRFVMSKEDILKQREIAASKGR